MRIAIVAPVWFSVPPTAYGGVEAVVHLQAEGLVEAGHEVTLFASGDSESSAELVSVFDTAPSERIGQTFWELQHLLCAVGRCDEFDVVHDHSGLLGLALLGQTGAPVVHTVHGPLTGTPGGMYADICAIARQVGLVSLSRNQRRPAPTLPWVANVPNAIDVSRYEARREPGDALAFVGRMSPDKGVHHAIEVARLTGRPLRIAAKCREPGEVAYFERHVRPRLGGEIEYLGELGHDDKLELLRTSYCLVFPIEWEEPFGLVMIEAMACGTPVVATRRGSVPEVVDHEKTGFVVDAVHDLPDAIDAAGTLDGALIQEVARRRFSAERMVEGYLGAYAMIAQGAPARADRVAVAV